MGGIAYLSLEHASQEAGSRRQDYGGYHLDVLLRDLICSVYTFIVCWLQIPEEAG